MPAKENVPGGRKQILRQQPPARSDRQPGLPAREEHPATVFRRAQQLNAPLTPGEISQLQRALGNRATIQLTRNRAAAVRITAAPATIQRKKFKDQVEVLSWVDAQYEALKTKVGKRMLELNADPFFELLLKNLGSDTNYGGTDQPANQGMLYRFKEAIQEHVEKLITTGEFEGAKKLRTLTADQYEHIFKGQLSQDKKRMTGYHWKGDSTAIAEGHGPETPLGEQGCYSQRVRSRTDETITKDKESTFFPDTWSRKDVIVAIEYAGAVGGNIFEVTKPQKGAGLRLFFNGDSYFPFFD